MGQAQPASAAGLGDEQVLHPEHAGQEVAGPHPGHAGQRGGGPVAARQGEERALALAHHALDHGERGLVRRGLVGAAIVPVDRHQQVGDVAGVLRPGPSDRHPPVPLHRRLR
jgi:hypothetical protein